MTTAETCERLRISRVTLWRWANAGKIEPIRLAPKSIRWRRDDVEWMCGGDDSVAVIRGALALLAEHHAEDKRPVCARCGQRRVRPGTEKCTPCHEADELQLAHKRRWWDQHGAEAKDRVRAKKAAASA